MSLKTPLFLALIVGSICVIAFLIWPAFGQIDLKQKELDVSQKLVNSIKNKNKNMTGLISSLNDEQDSTQKEFVLNYIPMEKREEKIFNSLSAIAESDGVKVALVNVSLEAKKEEARTAAPVDPQSSQEVIFGGAGNPDATSLTAPVSVLPSQKTIGAKMTVLGKYENIKQFVAKLYALDMLKDISSINLVSATGEGQSSDNLSAEILANFNYIPQAKINKDYNSPVFDKTQFNFASVDQIMSLLAQRAAAVSVENAGRSNPFLP